MYSKEWMSGVAKLIRKPSCCILCTLLVLLSQKYKLPSAKTHGLEASPAAYNAHSIAGLLWRLQEETDVVCEGFAEQPLLDAVTRVAGEKLILLEANDGICTTFIDVASGAKPSFRVMPT